ncbi:iron transporter [Corynebacterium sp. CCM 8835]|uniref:Iron transporter n=1 Tax=Corynebacterium antarcticum TaxID=2800405 RepID=A0A9Q4CDG4_9CORY|nr:iron transporter [Corynebacterium antarcticum]MCK7643011.1 iron transporter [Corynebacterium antarcticum]MCK7661514.1 iron transporter [Corynebacterium antarcticum]MCL0246257.1 iron transporter [Corynebacterium antarcticum]MCX7492508.1 iron transporter [Corynebacterium antarcticum]MCX7538385.1 iron transporter [Corynebacterium antarcticum]
MNKRLMRKAAAIAVAATTITTTLTACSSDGTEGSAEESTTTAAAATSGQSGEQAGDPRLEASVCGTPEDDGENHEIPIGSTTAGPFDIDAAYFQPAYMNNNGESMPSYKDSIAHIEADVKTNEKGEDYGWSVGETPADLRISYKITDADGKEIVSGKFMEMNAVDGSHYGTNIPRTAEAKGLVGTLDDPAHLTLTLKVEAPEHYPLHIDRRTGVKEHEWFKPITVKMEMLYTGEQLKCIVDDPVADNS